MKTIAIVFCISVFLVACNDVPKEEAQTTDTSQEQTGDQEVTIENLVPEGYTLFQTYKGDLNKDAYEDMVLVFDAIDTNDEMINRAVMLVTTDSNGKLHEAAFNKEGAYCAECGGVIGDPFTGVVIKNGYFTIEHYGGSRERWTDDPTFKYNPEDGKWYLHKHNKEMYDTLNPEDESLEDSMLTTKDFGVVNFEDFRY